MADNWNTVSGRGFFGRRELSVGLNVWGALNRWEVGIRAQTQQKSIAHPPGLKRAVQEELFWSHVLVAGMSSIVQMGMQVTYSYFLWNQFIQQICIEYFICAWQRHIIGSLWFAQNCIIENFMWSGKSALCMVAVYLQTHI